LDQQPPRCGEAIELFIQAAKISSLHATGERMNPGRMTGISGFPKGTPDVNFISRIA